MIGLKNGGPAATMLNSAITTADAVALVSAAFSRAVIGTTTVHEAARDAVEFVRLVRRFRHYPRDRALPAKSVARAKALAHKYGAELQTPLDPHGMAVGLAFSPNVHVSGFRSVLFVC